MVLRSFHLWIIIIKIKIGVSERLVQYKKYL